MPRIVWAVLAILVLSASPCVSAAGCAAGIVLQDTDGGVPQAVLSVRLVDGTGTSHTIATDGVLDRVEFEELGCGPSTVEVYLAPDPDKWVLDKPLRLARKMFNFGEYGSATVEISTPPIRRVLCRVVDSANKPVGGGTIEASPIGSERISSIAIGARIQDDGLGELLLTKGAHRLTYGDADNFLAKATTIDGEAPESEVLDVGDSVKSVEFVVTRPALTITVKGDVVDPDGAGIEGVEVRSTVKHAKSTESDDDGRFVLRIAANTKKVTLEATDPEARWVFDRIRLDVGQDNDGLKFVARRWPGQRIQARLLGSDSGEPISGVHIMADLDCLEKAPRRSLSLLTDERGAFDIPCSPGCPSTVDLYPYWSNSPEYFHEQEMSVPASACGDTWVIHLERGATLSGNVVDMHGHGVSALHLKLVRDGETSVNESTTGLDGSYSFHPLVPGRYEVQLHEMLVRGVDRFFFLAGEGQPLAPLPLVEIAGKQDTKLDIVAKAGGMLCVEGVQTPSDSRPLPITWLYVVPADDPFSAGGRVYDLRNNRSSQGGCTLGLPAGKWRFAAAGSHFLGESLVVPAWNLTGEPTTSPVVVKPNERTVVKALPGQVAGGLAIGLRDFELTIADRISLEIAHQPERGTGAWSWLPVPPERYWTAAAGPNGEPGVFAIIPPGEYKLRLKIKKSEEAMSSAWILDSAVSVVAGKTSEITMKRAALDSW